MANNAGAKKAIRKIAARTEVNKARRTRVRTFLRKFQEAVTGGGAGIGRALRRRSCSISGGSTAARNPATVAACCRKLVTC